MCARKLEFYSTKPKLEPCIEELPEEIMEMVVYSKQQLTGGKASFVLSNNDLCNLRLACRTTRNSTDYAFAKRVFASRMHMLSSHGLQALIDISRSKNFNQCVKEIVLGPERVNERLIMELGGIPTSWYYTFGAKWRELVVEQQRFVTKGIAVHMLQTIFCSFPNLQVIRIESWPELCEYDAASGSRHSIQWRRAWGSATILRQLGNGRQFNTTNGPVLFRPWNLIGGLHRTKVFWHLPLILTALHWAKNTQYWTIELSLAPCLWKWEPRPIDISSAEWLGLKERVSFLKLRGLRFLGGDQLLQMAPPVSGWGLSSSWAKGFLEHCKNIKSLDLVLPRNPQCFLLSLWTNLRRIKLGNCSVQDALFHEFLIKISGTMDDIVLENVELSPRKGPSGTFLSEYHNRDVSWWAKFEVMLEMRQLHSIDLDCLTWEPTTSWHGHFSIPFNPLQHAFSRKQLGKSIALRAVGKDVFAALRRVIDAKQSYSLSAGKKAVDFATEGSDDNDDGKNRSLAKQCRLSLGRA